jgi:hypothetical protein
MRVQAEPPDEAYAAKAMPDLGLEIEDFQAQTWRIEQWSQQPKRLVGPEFSCGGHKWCVSLLHHRFHLTCQADFTLSSGKRKWATERYGFGLPRLCESQNSS